MPELPEVETVVRGLRRTVGGQTIARVRVNAPQSSIHVSGSLKAGTFSRALAGRTIRTVNRRGKNILVSLSGGVTLWIHLKMTGHFHYLDRNAPIGKHDLVVFDFKSEEDGVKDMNLRFNDYRRFGRLRLFTDREIWQQPGLGDLGPEPLEIAPAEFVQLFQSTRRMIKPALLDQTFLAGMGNIYADESLYACRIHPQRITSSLSAKKLTELHGHIQRLLKSAISKMGTSVDTFSGVNGRPGRFQKYLMVYDRENTPCLNCGRMIVREKIGSRSAHFCPRCQRRKP